MSNKDNSSLYGKKDNACLFQILDDMIETFSSLLQEKNEESHSSMCSLWVDDPTSTQEGTYGSYIESWENGILTDVTLLVGPEKVPIKVHKVVLAAHFEYFRSMFSGGLKESASTEVYLPFVGPEDLKLILKYSYSEKRNLLKRNVFKMVVMANYFGSHNLTEKCCSFIKNFINKRNCFKLVEAASQLDLNQLKKFFVLFIVDHLPEVNKDDLSALPVDLLLEIIQHPAAVMVKGDAAESEKQLFHLIWNQVKCFSEEEKTECIPRVLKSIHLPFTSKRFLFFLLREVGHISEARDLILKAEEDLDLSETREWCLRRCKAVPWIRLFKCGGSTRSVGYKCDKPIEVNGTTSDEYSTCVLIKGFPFFVYATSSPTKKERQYHVESPWAIEHLGLPYKVVLEVKQYFPVHTYVPVNTYYNIVVEKRPMDESYRDEHGWFRLRVRLQ